MPVMFQYCIKYTIKACCKKRDEINNFEEYQSGLEVDLVTIMNRIVKTIGVEDRFVLL